MENRAAYFIFLLSQRIQLICQDINKFEKNDPAPHETPNPGHNELSCRVVLRDAEPATCRRKIFCVLHHSYHSQRIPQPSVLSVARRTDF